MSATARDAVLPSGETHGDTMREPHRTRFIEMIRRGAAARDIHDSDGSGDYDSRFDGEVSERFLEREISRVAMHAQSLCAPLASRVGHAPRILDVGCGTGGTTVALAMSALAAEDVVGIDASREAVEAAAVRALGHGLDPARVRFEHVEAGARLPFPDGHFDLVVLMHALTYAARPAVAVAEAARVLRPGGRLLLSSLARHEHKAAVEAYGHVNLGFSDKDLRKFVEKAGLLLATSETVTREKRPPHFEVISIIGTKP